MKGRKIYCVKVFSGLCLLLGSLGAWAQEKSDYKFEISPVVGRNLPYNIDGASKTLAVYGLRGAVPVGSKGALESGLLYHVRNDEKAYTLDFGYRYETAFDSLNFILDIGLHASRFSLKPDYDSGGLCVPATCRTDSGNHFGLYLGGGLQVPLSPTLPLKIRMRFYKNPQVWLLLEMDLGLRF